MSKLNVLVFPCGSEIGLEIHRSVRFSTHFSLIGASSADDHGRYVYDRYIPKLPFVGDDEFASAIGRVIRENEVRLIMPAHDSAVLMFAQMAARDELGCKLVTSPLQTCELTRSKRATYQRFAGVIPVPEVYEDVAAARYPAFLKPDVGQGSKGTSLADNVVEAAFQLKRNPSLLVLEYLPGPEFTIDCFTDKAGELLYCEGRTRARVLNGISVRSATIENGQFGMLAKTINQTIKLRGAWFFQVKERPDGELVLMEIGPRVAGTMSVSRARGVNLPLLSLFDALEQPVAILQNDYKVTVDRALQSRFSHDLTYERVYLDFDDTVVIDGAINPIVMAFVYQCKNRHIPISLITRHSANLENTLHQLCLERLFDELIWLRNGEGKADYIKEQKSIFIDDSWTERAKVHDACRIPVFDTAMIEVLLENI